MDIISKIKSCFRPSKLSAKEGSESAGKALELIFKEYLRIKDEIKVSDFKLNGGINFKIDYQGSIVPFWLAVEPAATQLIVEKELQDALSSIAVGLALGLNLVEISQHLTK